MKINTCKCKKIVSLILCGIFAISIVTLIPMDMGAAEITSIPQVQTQVIPDPLAPSQTDILNVQPAPVQPDPSQLLVQPEPAEQSSPKVVPVPKQYNEQVFDEDKEAVVEDNKRSYPKWQGRRKKPVKDYEYSIKVNKKTCTVTVYIKEESGKLTPYKAMVCSVGREGHDTPEGKGYHTSDYYDWRLMVDNTFGRYAVRFNGSIMFHSVPYYKSKKDSLEWQDYNKLGKPASLGCIRLAVADAKWIYDNCKRGTEVEVYSGPASTDPLGTPVPIELDIESEYRDWDPTDLTPENPWLVPVE